MSGRLARLAAAMVLATGLATIAFAAPAHAEGEVDVNLGSLDSSMEAGDNDNFTVRLRNQTDQDFRGIRVVFTIRMDGLQTQHVRIVSEGQGGFGQLNRQSGGDGVVRLFDIGRFLNRDNRPLDSLNLRYRIEFTDSAPGGQARVDVAAMLNNQVLGSDQDELRIRGGEPPTEPPTTTEGPRSEEPGPVLATPPAERAAATASDNGGPPAILYVLGALLVLAGTAMLWLLFRRPRPALVGGAPTPFGTGPVNAGPFNPGPYNTGQTDTGPMGGVGRLSHPVYPPPPGPMPRRSAPPPTEPFRSTPPTAAMPTVNPTYAPHHSAVDPWADSAEDQFPR
jgi:hypothetical protein